MAISNLLSGRVRVVSPKNVTLDRYQFVDLSQVEPNLGVPNFSASLSGSPAIVVSDDQGNRGFVRSLDLDRASGRFTGSFTGSFTGDGAELFNLPAATKISSGSATASFIEGDLLINTDTRIQGNLVVDESIYADQIIVNIISSSIIYSSGSNIFGDDITDIQQFTGSVEVRDRLFANVITGSSIAGALTGSFIGIAEATGSFSGSFTGSFFGDGRDLFNLPQATKLASGSVTASVSPENGFLIISQESGSTFTGSLFVSGNITIPSGSGYFSGSGEGLFNIPLSALNIDSLVATKIATGSVTASVTPQFGFKVESILSGSQFTGSLKISGSVSISSGSVFSGSGRDLFDIPRSALTPDALDSDKISSGSVTASVAPSTGFVVTSVASGSAFTGSVRISGSLIANGVSVRSGSFFSGSGRDLFDIPRSALTPDALDSTRIATGSVTASVTPEFGFRVESTISGSQFTGSILVSGSVELYTGSFSGSGKNLREIPKSAISDLDTSLIFSGSATASINPVRGFNVNIFSQFSGSMVVSASNFIIPTSSLDKIFYVSNSGISAYIFNGITGSNPTITLVRGVEYRFELSASGHPFYIKTTQTTGPASAYNVGVTNNGDDSGSIVFAVQVDAPNTLYYNCQFHSEMAGVINIVDNIIRPSEIKFIGDTTISGSLALKGDNVIDSGFQAGQIVGANVDGNIHLNSGSYFSGSGKYIFDISLSNLTGDAFRIASGSVTASVSPAYGFKVEALDIGSQFTGSVNISGSTTSSLGFRGYKFVGTEFSGSSFSGSFEGDGSRLRNVPSVESARITSGSVTASVSPVYGFRVESAELGSEFTGSIKLSSGSVFSGSGRDLFDIPESALSFAPFRIASGSVTASVAPNRGFRVESWEYGSEFTGSLIVSGTLGIRVASGSSFSGSGRNLFDIPRSAISDLDTSLIFSGSATASIAPNKGLLVNTGVTIGGYLFTTGSATFYGTSRFTSGVSASVFSGSGAGLTDIPFSALSQELFRIASGSVTASALPDRGFIVETGNLGARISGSLFVSGGYGGVIQAATGSWFSGSGRGLFDIPRNALTEDALLTVEIKSGSVTASVSPQFGFKVESLDSGSQFTGSINVSGSVSVISGSYFVGDGRYLSNITLANLAIDSTKIFSGSATASISPDEGFNVNVQSTLSGSLYVYSTERETPSYLIDTVFNVAADGSSAYTFSGAANGSNPALTLVRGIEYTFNLNAAGHPFYIKFQNSTGTTNAVSGGITNNGTDVGTLTFTPYSGS